MPHSRAVTASCPSARLLQPGRLQWAIFPLPPSPLPRCRPTTQACSMAGRRCARESGGGGVAVGFAATAATALPNQHPHFPHT